MPSAASEFAKTAVRRAKARSRLGSGLGEARTVQVVPLGLRRPAFLKRVIGACSYEGGALQLPVALLGPLIQPSP
jgi:hypothetical protein